MHRVLKLGWKIDTSFCTSNLTIKYIGDVTLKDQGFVLQCSECYWNENKCYDMWCFQGKYDDWGKYFINDF